MDQAERENSECAEQHQRRRETRRSGPLEQGRIPRAQIIGIRWRQFAHARRSLPNKRPRIQPVPISMTNTERIIINRIALTSE